MMNVLSHYSTSFLVITTILIAWAGCGGIVPAPVPSLKPQAAPGPECGPDLPWRLSTTESFIKQAMGGPPSTTANADGTDAALPAIPERLRERAKILDQWAFETRAPTGDTPWGTSYMNVADKFAALASGARALADSLGKNDEQAMAAARNSLMDKLKEVHSIAASANKRCFAAAKTPSSTALAPKEIQATVRANFGMLRLCYHAGLVRTPKLTGTITIRFIIKHDGTVPLAVLDDTDLPDPAVVDCILPKFMRLIFPPPGSTVTVVYPINFLPGK